MNRVSTTDFFTLCWKNARLKRWAVLGWMVLTITLGSAVRAEPAGPTLSNFSLQRTDSGVYLTASVQLELPPLVEDALKKGIPIYFVIEADLLRDRWYWYDSRVASVARHLRLAYQPLTRRWRLNSAAGPISPAGLGVSVTQQFDTLAEALAVMLRLSSWKIAEPGDIDPRERYNVDFRFRLDTGQLPRLLQLAGPGQTDWTLALSHNQRLSIGERR